MAHYETGYAKPPYERLIQLSLLFEVSPEYFFPSQTSALAGVPLQERSERARILAQQERCRSQAIRGHAQTKAKDAQQLRHDAEIVMKKK